MAYRAYPLHEFGGLRLDTAVDELGATGAIDMLNVELMPGGAIKTRRGYSMIGTPVNSYSFLSTLALSDTVGGYFAQRGTTLVALDTSAAEAFTIGATSPIFSSVNFGAMSAGVQDVLTYFSDGVNLLWRFQQGVGWSGRAGSPYARYVAVQPNENRLVAAGTIDNGQPTGGGSASSGSHVWFSNPGAPETWSANNYVILDPADGETIVGATSWGDLLLVFKQTKMYVFYGNSLDASGNPVFNYRTVSLGTRIPLSNVTRGPRAISTPEGVYFVSADGIYLTNGSRPVSVSDELYPLRTGGEGPNSFATRLSTIDIGTAGLHYHQGRLYVNTYLSAGSSVVFVLDKGQWLVWAPSTSRKITWLASLNENLVSVASNANGIARHRETDTTDNGTAIDWAYRTSFYNAGSDFNKQIKETEVWGTGTVDYKLSTDFGSLSSANTLTLGTSPAIAKGTARISKTGTVFSHQFSGTGAAVVHRCVQMIANERQPGTKQ